MPKSKRAKATAIQDGVKLAVWKRQRGRSLFAPYHTITPEMCCCHFISRGQGGKGIEENIFGCYQAPWLNEHDLFDQHKPIGNLTADQAHLVVRSHLQSHYRNWKVEDLKYKWEDNFND